MTMWLGLDIGTSSLKAIMVSDDGTPVLRTSVPYTRQQFPVGNRAEQDPASWLEAARTAIAECLQLGTPSGIGLTGQVPTLVLVDENGEPVRPAMTWQDTRAVEEAQFLESELGSSLRHIGIELPWSAAHLPAKLLWLARHDPASRARGRVALQPKDYLGLGLTGSQLSDVWSVKGIGNVPNGAPATEVLAAAGWDDGVCPPVAPPGSSRGVTRGEALGLPVGIPVSVGCSDALASMLAVGAFSEAMAFVLTGTSDIIGLSTDNVAPEATGLYRIPPQVTPRSVIYGPTQSSGATALWLARLFSEPIEDLARIAGTADPAHCPIFVPYISGERAPLWRPDVRGLFANVDAQAGKPELIRSVLRGIALSASHVLSIAADASAQQVNAVHIAGRGSDDLDWKQIRLETLGLPVVFHTEPFTSALGAAMLGAAAANSGDLAAGDHLKGASVTVEPSPADVEFSRAALLEYTKASHLAQSWSPE